jgi:hypothetical protein
MLLGEGPENSEREGVTAALTSAMKTIQPIARQLRLMGAGARHGVLSMPEFQAKY